MSHTSSKTTDELLFGDVIYTYPRAQAIEDGVLIDPGSMAKEVSNLPVRITANMETIPNHMANTPNSIGIY